MVGDFWCVVGQMNKFRNDGSFLAKFSGQGDQEGGERRGGDGADGAAEASRNRDRETRAGDWFCPKCNANVFASREQVASPGSIPCTVRPTPYTTLP